MARKKFPTYTTPEGTARYPWLHRPDTKFNSDGEFKVNLLVSEADSRKLRRFLEKKQKAARKEILDEAKNKRQLAKWRKYEDYLPFEEFLDDEGEPTGDYEIKFKQKAIIRNKEGEEFRKRVFVFDSALKPITKDTEVWGGSRIKVSFGVGQFRNDSAKIIGITLRLLAVQVIELAEQPEADGSRYGFEPEEGFEALDDVGDDEDSIDLDDDEEFSDDDDF